MGLESSQRSAKHTDWRPHSLMLTQLATPFMRGTARRMLRFGEEKHGTITPSPVQGRRYLLYIHVPYCEALCPYCSFHRVKYQPENAARYFIALRSEIEHYADLGFEFSDVYVGGGTPTVNLPELKQTLDLVHERFSIQSISVETNPNHLNDTTFRTLHDIGVNRLSVGVQTFDNDLLKAMDRYDRYGSGEEIVRHLKSAKDQFDTLNIDLIFNLPNQTQSMLRRDLDTVLETGVSQVSTYPLMVANSTRKKVGKVMGTPTFEAEQSMYFSIVDTLSPVLTPSSVWCFSQDEGQIDEYIVDHPEFVGVGSGAFSYLNGSLYATSFSINRYDELLTRQPTGITRSRPLSRREQLEYHLLTSLFGLTLKKETTIELFGEAGWRSLWPEMTGLSLIGAIGKSPGEISLTRRGQYYWLVAMREFLTGVNNFRDEMRAHIKEEYEASYGESIPLVTVD